MTRAEKSRIMHRVFSAQEIEDRMQQISKGVLVEIQKQIYKGEEAYFEDTNGHGNLFRGWDAFVDSKEIGTTGATSVPQGTKRIPADCRWFSMSSRRPLKPARSNTAAPVQLPPSGQPTVETLSTSETKESSSAPSASSTLDQIHLQPETTASISNSIVKKESIEMKNPAPAKTELAATEDEKAGASQPQEESKRKHHDAQTEQATIENNERKKKKARDERGEEKTVEPVAMVEAERTAEDKSSAVETKVGLDKKVEPPDEPDMPKKKSSNDQADQREIEESRSESLKTDSKAKREEPQKRRSSRNRRSS